MQEVPIVPSDEDDELSTAHNSEKGQPVSGSQEAPIDLSLEELKDKLGRMQDEAAAAVAAVGAKQDEAGAAAAAVGANQPSEDRAGDIHEQHDAGGARLQAEREAREAHLYQQVRDRYERNVQAASSSVLDLDSMPGDEILAKLKTQLSSLPGQKRSRSAMSSGSVDQMAAVPPASVAVECGGGGCGGGGRSGGGGGGSSGGDGGGVVGGGGGGDGGGQDSDGKGSGAVVLNVKQQLVHNLIEKEGKSVVVIGAAGSGKTLTITHAAERWLHKTATGKVLMVAPYNTQVDKLFDDISTCPLLMQCLGSRLMLKTASAAFNLPMKAIANAQLMAQGLNAEMMEVLRTDELLIIIDEAALLKYINRDAISELLGIIRNDATALDGGAQILEVSDPCQGLAELVPAELSPAQKQEFMINGVLRREVYTDGEFMQDPRREKVFFTEVRRFVGPLKDVYVAGADALRYGDAGRAAQDMTRIATEREFDMKEDLEALTLYGTSKEVVEGHVPRTLMRAAARGHTEANGGVFIFKSPEAHQYGERQLNSLRPWGFETLALAVGELYLLIVKSMDCVAPDDVDADDAGEAEEESGVRFEDGKYASGNMVCEVLAIMPGRYAKVKVLTLTLTLTLSVRGAYIMPCRYAKVKVLRRNGSSGILYVPWKRVSKNGVVLDLIGLKPYYERVVDLAQGFETTKPVHVVARRIFGRGKFYVAVTRCRDLRQLKITGVETFAELRRVVKSSWRVLYFLSKHGVVVPRMSLAYAEKEHAAFQLVCCG